jgi:hypothetical protein
MAETKSISIDASKSVRGRPPVLPDGVSVKLDQATGMLEVLLLTVQDQKIELFETTPGTLDQFLYAAIEQLHDAQRMMRLRSE